MAIDSVIRDIDQRLIRWGNWRLKQAQVPGVRCDTLARLLGEFSEAYRRFGKAALNDKPYAALIRGNVRRPESQDADDEEWETQGAIDAMPKYLSEIKKVLLIEYLTYGMPESKIKAAKVSRACYFSHRRQGHVWIQAYLQAKIETV